MTVGLDPFALLPATYRTRDARPDGHPGFLEALLGLVAEIAQELGDDLDQLYDDLFIETCAPWVVPYIGDLIGVTLGRGVDGVTATGRAAVANAIAHRRRKGTLAGLEQSAFDATGWPVVAEEMFTRLAVTENLNHRRGRAAFASLGDALALEALDGPFDVAPRTLEVRKVASSRGRYNIGNIALTVWRRRAESFTDVDPVAVDTQRFRFNPLGFDVPLVIRAQPSQPGTLNTVVNVPQPISRRRLAADVERPAPALDPLYGDSASISIVVGGALVPASSIRSACLEDVIVGGTPTWAHLDDLAATEVAVDPQLGRFAFATAPTSAPMVSFTLARSLLAGADEDARTMPPDPPHVVPETVGRVGAVHATVTAAVAATGGDGVVEVIDNADYDVGATVTVPAAGHFELRSRSQVRPFLTITNELRIDAGDNATIVLDGVVLRGGPIVITGTPATIELRHCTLVPGWDRASDGSALAAYEPSLVLATDSTVPTEILVEDCITGPLVVPPDANTLTVRDSVVDAGGGDELAVAVPVLVSADLPIFPALGAGALAVVVLIGDADPFEIDIGTGGAPADIAAAATALEDAIRAAGGTAGASIRVLALDARLVVVDGAGAQVSLRVSGGDATAATLGFDVAGEARTGLLSGAIAAPLVLAAANPQVQARSGPDRVTLDLGSATNLAGAAAAVESAVRASTLSDAATTLVAALGDRLLVVGGRPGATVAFEPTTADADTAAALQLLRAPDAIAADLLGGFGASATIERTTLFGATRLEVLTYASDTICAGPLVVQFAQEGCVRFSYLAAGSRSPRRHRCLPDHGCVPPLAFSSLRFGEPGYGQLRRLRSAPIFVGASDGAEMGAASSLQDPQRFDNLRHELDESLRFSLEAGVFDAS